MTCVSREAIRYWWPWSVDWQEHHVWPELIWPARRGPTPCDCGEWPSVEASLNDVRWRRARDRAFLADA